MKSLAEQETQPKPRLIVRLGVFLASHRILFRFTILSPSCCSLNPSFHPFSFPKLTIHHFPVSVLCCSAGIITLLLLPSLAKNTYLSENALIPGILPSSLFLFTVTLLMHTCCCSWRVCPSGPLGALHPDLQMIRLHTVHIL